MNRPDFERDGFERRKSLAKRHARLYYAVEISFAVIFFALLLITAQNHENQVLDGWCYVAMTVNNLALTVFIIFAEKHEWSRFYVCSYDYILGASVDEDKRKNDIRSHRITMGIIVIVLIAVGVYFLITGIKELI